MEIHDLARIIKDIEDHLIPFLKLDTSERSLYYHLFRHTRLIDKREVIFVISTAHTVVGIKEYVARDRLRKMDKKGCIKINETRRDGLKIQVLLPTEIEGCVVAQKEEIITIDIETINFYSHPKYREAILKRENGECFYCLRKTTNESCVLDHLIPRANGGDNSYRNIVAVCHECNSKKAGRHANDFVRKLYRDGILSQKELEQRLAAIEAVESGHIKPEI
jgi:hypothetical protein